VGPVLSTDAPSFASGAPWTLGHAASGGADGGEALVPAQRVGAASHHSWHGHGPAPADRAPAATGTHFPRQFPIRSLNCTRAATGMSA